MYTQPSSMAYVHLSACGAEVSRLFSLITACPPHLSGSSSSNKSSSRSKLILPDIFLAASRFLALSSGVLLGPRQSSGLGLVLLPRGRPRPLLRPSPSSFASCSASLSDRAYVHVSLIGTHHSFSIAWLCSNIRVHHECMQLSVHPFLSSRHTSSSRKVADMQAAVMR